MGQDEKPTLETRQQVLRDVLVALFATPAALSVLSKLDKRLDFSPLLERLILNFRKVVSAVWQALSDLIGLDLTRYADFLTFAVLMLGPLYAARGYRWLQEPVAPPNEPENHAKESNIPPTGGILIPITAICFVLFLVKLFQIGDALFFLVPPLAIVIGAGGLYAGAKQRYIPIIVLSVGFLAIGFHDFWQDIDYIWTLQTSWDVKLAFFAFAFVGVWLVWKALSEATKTLAYVGFWVIGILLINWLVTTAIPAVDGFLTRAGA